MASSELKKFSKDTTLKVEVHITRQFKIRVAIASFLIRMAARVLGCGIVINGKSPEVPNV